MRFLVLHVIILQTVGQLGIAMKVRFIAQYEEIFTVCSNQPDNVLDIHGIWDLSGMEFERNDNFNINIRGNLTFIWDIVKRKKNRKNRKKNKT